MIRNMPDAQLAPAIAVERCGTWDDDHAASVEAKSGSQRLERAFLRTPKATYNACAIRHAGESHQRLLLNREIVSDEIVAPRLDELHIAPQFHTRPCHGASRHTGAVAK